MLKLVVAILNRYYKIKILKSPNINISQNSRINYRGIKLTKNNTLMIGEKTIVEGGFVQREKRRHFNWEKNIYRMFQFDMFGKDHYWKRRSYRMGM